MKGSHNWLLAAAVFLCTAGRAVAILPWTLLINTNNVINVTNAAYGAVGDGVTTNTTAIQNAINKAASGGTTNGAAGGTVEIPPGIYLSGPLTLASSVNLQVDPGAILRMLPFTNYPIVIATNVTTSYVTNLSVITTNYSTNFTWTAATFISGSSLHDIELSGGGAIDGQGSPWWPYSNTNGFNRPRMFSPSSCNRVLVQNLTLSNSPMFHIAISGGGNTIVSGVTVFAPANGPNTDACDVSGTNILVQNCNISVGDDDYTCGGGTHDVLLTNNVYGTGHGVSIGSYTDSGGVSNITVVNCSFTGTDNGIRLKSERGRGGIVQNLTYANLTMTNVAWPLLVYSYYEVTLGPLTGVNPTYAANLAATNYTAYTSTDPFWRNITFSNITAVATPSGRPPFMVWGLPEVPASNIVFRAINITSASTLPPEILNATNIQLIDCNFNLPAGVKELQCYNASITFSNTPGGAAATNQWLLDGLTTNGYGNTLQFYNALATLKNTNALDNGPLTLAASTLTISNDLTLFPTTVLNFTLGTNATTLAVKGNLTYGGTNNIFAGPGFTNGVYTLATKTGQGIGALPTLGISPTNYNCTLIFGAATPDLLLNVALLPPTNLLAAATNLQINLKWNAVTGATNYNVKRGTVSGTYPTVFSSATATNYADASVTAVQNYYYVVSALGAGGESTNSLQVTAKPLPSSRPTNITAQVSGGQLQLAWPQSHLGWRLLIQTNNLARGLSTNWATVPNSTNVISTNIPVTATNGAVFLKLVYP
jgi:polygalacturonase